VFVRGNAATAPERVAKIALLRAARLTLEHGGDRFALVHSGGMSYHYTTLNSVVVGAALIPVGTSAGEDELAALVVHVYRPGDAVLDGGERGGGAAAGGARGGAVYEARQIAAELEPQFKP